MEVQTDSGRGTGTGTDASIGADFGPEKPRRVDFRDDNEYEPLLHRELPLGAVDPRLKTADRAVDNSVEDETKEYKLEGSDSLATSLSSIDTAVSERDWEETFRALGPRFASMLDDVTPVQSDDSSEETSDGTEI
jgi:hypothetical protein